MELFNPYKGVHGFSKGTSPKVNIIAGLQFERSYDDITVKHLSHYVMNSLAKSKSAKLSYICI